MKKILSALVFTLFLTFLVPPQNAHAIENPLSVPNNKIGIHILFDYELADAAKLINSNGGDWGYVIIPIQSGDKDLSKWQKFMDDARENHIIPIIRLATEGDYFNTKVWRKPTTLDVIDFANFLDSLDWPVKNKYVVVFNEVNRGDEWGGSINPAEYASLLSFSVSVFKSKNPDFFIISAGMDNAAPNRPPAYLNQYNYLRQMNAAVPGIFNQIDGLSSHSYPNPGFSQPPDAANPMGVGSFAHERSLIKTMSPKELPVFITETGWSTDAISEDQQIIYYQQALNTIWSDPGIVTVIPFLLQGTGGPFQKFTFIGEAGYLTKQYLTLQQFPKVKGIPRMPVSVLSAETTAVKPKPLIVKKELLQKEKINRGEKLTNWLVDMYKWVFKL